MFLSIAVDKVLNARRCSLLIGGHRLLLIGCKLHHLRVYKVKSTGLRGHGELLSAPIEAIRKLIAVPLQVLYRNLVVAAVDSAL